MADVIRVVVAAPHKPAITKTIPNTLEAMSQEVGGHIEIFRFDGLMDHHRIHCYIHEEGKLKGDSLNLVIPGDVIVGNIIASKSDSDGKEIGLSEREAKFACLYLNNLRGLP
jgi:hypothetical protein